MRRENVRQPTYLASLAQERAQHLLLEGVRARSKTNRAKPWLRFEVRALQFLDARRADSR
jgi:hypothetical protein